MILASVRRSMKILPLVGLLSIGGAIAQAAGETWTTLGKITLIEAGWTQDTMSVYHTYPWANPSNCPVTNAGYATDPNDPGRGLFHSVIEKAYRSGKNAQLLIAGCVFNKPRIIAVKMFPTTTPPVPSLTFPALLPPPTVPSATCDNQGVITVRSASALKHALESGHKGTIFIPSNTIIDLVDVNGAPLRNLAITDCVTLKGTRGGLDPGALLWAKVQNRVKGSEEPIFRIAGSNVRIEGLRFQGPAPTDDRTNTGGRVTAIAIWGDTTYDIVIDNNDFFFWNHAVGIANHSGMSAMQVNRIRITRNYFHRNANNGNGYGVLLADGDGYVSIEGNLFTHNRHAISASGGGNGGYLARYNYVLEGGFTEDEPGYWNQHFDVHGAGDGGYGGQAREYFEVASNTIRGEQGYYQVMTRAAFMLRGKPTIGASFHDNVVVHNNLDAAVALKTGWLSEIGEDHTKFNFIAGTNKFDTDTTGELAVGDFDGDGRDDVFLANGTGWWYSSAGKTEWRFMRPSTRRVADLRFGRFDGDARTDVLALSATGGWDLYSGGTSEPTLLRNDGTRLTDCVFGDFNGDGITDALRANGTTWSVAYGARGAWISMRNSSISATNMRVGNFMDDLNEPRRDEIFVIESLAISQAKVWSFWRFTTTAQNRGMTALSIDMASLVVGDFDGDGRSDIAQTDGGGWRWWRNGSTNWAQLRDSGGQWWYDKDIRSVLLGRFTADDSRFDALRYEVIEETILGTDNKSYPYTRKFAIWDGTQDAFKSWTPDLQEMR